MTYRALPRLSNLWSDNAKAPHESLTSSEINEVCGKHLTGMLHDVGARVTARRKVIRILCTFTFYLLFALTYGIDAHAYPVRCTSHGKATGTGGS